MIYLGGQPARGFDDGERADLRRCLTETLGTLKAFAEALTPRETTILALGLAASHLEESIVHGDWKRAEAHADNLVKLLGQLGVGAKV
jgi:hypothetical protein